VKVITEKTVTKAFLSEQPSPQRKGLLKCCNNQDDGAQGQDVGEDAGAFFTGSIVTLIDMINGRF
jgi:hypothetical protein